MYMLVINVTTACDKGCTANVGLLVTLEMNRKEKRRAKKQQTEKVPSWGRGELVSHISG